MVTECLDQGPARGAPRACGWVRKMGLVGAWFTVAAAAVWLAGCLVDGNPIVESEETRSSALVSDPAPGVSASTRTSGSAPVIAEASQVVYVSIPPDSIPGAEAALIQNPRNGMVVTAAMVNGGLDPVPIAAGAGDTLELGVRGAGLNPLDFTFVVPEAAKPRVVRTYPPHKKRDVVLNARPYLIFTEPVVLGEGSVELLRGSEPVPGELQFNDPDHLSALFVPLAPLAAGTTYRLVATQAVRDLDGDALDAPLAVEFTTANDSVTGTLPAARLSILKVDGDGQTDTVLATLNQPLRVRVLRDGDPASAVTVRWSLEGQGETSSTTDASGVASATWTLGSSPSDKEAVAWLEGTDDTWYSRSVTFTATALPGKPVQLGPWGWANYVPEPVGTLSTPLSIDYETMVTDAHGNPVPGDFEIVWEVTLGGGSIQPIPAPYQSDPGHYARHTLAPQEGPNQVTATAPGLPGSRQVTFNATGVTALVKVRNDFFDSDSVAVLAGQTVGWIWGTDNDITGAGSWDPRLHDVLFEDDPASPISSLAQSFGVHTRTFTTPGTYRYRCTLHSPSFHSGHAGMVVVR